MSCNGCRVLRKGCSETCILRPCLQWIDSPESQGHATVFVAKFFGRAGLMSFISSVPHSQRPALFQSLLFEACGRTVNPVNGAVGLLWTGNWSVCQTAVETVLRGGVLRPMPEIMNNGSAAPKFEDSSCDADDMISVIRSKAPPLKRKCYDHSTKLQTSDLDLRLTPSLPMNLSFGCKKVAKSRSTTPSMNSEESGTTSTNTRRSAAFFSNGFDDYKQQFTVEQPKLLNLFS